MRLATCGLAAFLAVAAGLPAAAAALAQEVTPAGAMPAAQCQIEPRSAGFFDQLAATPGVTPAAGQVAVATPFAIPQGQPADQATIDAITATEGQLVACLNAGDYLRAYALYSDAYIRRNLSPQDIGALDATPVAAPADAQLTLQGVRDVVLLPDGRAGALVDLSSAAAGGAVTTSYVLFTNVAGQWQIDEETVLEAGSATPVVATPTA